MIKSVLLTAASEDTEVFRKQLESESLSLLHYPLEIYKKTAAPRGNLGDFENIVYGCKRNALFFVEWMKESGNREEVRERLNLALTRHAADYLEEEGIPAVHPECDGKAVDLLEFMLRLRRTGKTLYPCGDKTKEELPGLLKELDFPVEEQVLFRLEGPDKEDLRKYREDLATHDPAVVIFHSRRSVNRTRAAFPLLDYEGRSVITGDRGVTDKLKELNIPVDAEAKGSWDSILKRLKKILNEG